MMIRDLSATECMTLIAANRLGRLACARDGRPYVVPVFYTCRDNAAYVFTLPGRKLETMRSNPQVALLVEEPLGGRHWRSVLAEGRFEELPDRIGHKRQREHAWSLLSRHANWWEPGALKPEPREAPQPSEHVFFRIAIEQVSGREAMDAGA